jgi:hypothetical protein
MSALLRGTVLWPGRPRRSDPMLGGEAAILLERIPKTDSRRGDRQLALSHPSASFPVASAAGPVVVLMLQPKSGRSGAATLRAPTGGMGEPREKPIEPEAGENPDQSRRVPSPDQPKQLPAPSRARTNPSRRRAAPPARQQRALSRTHPGPAEGGEAAAGPGAGRTAPGALAPPRERRNPAAPPDLSSRGRRRRRRGRRTGRSGSRPPPCARA